VVGSTRAAEIDLDRREPNACGGKGPQVRAVIVGGGLVGSTLAARLSREGHAVVVVENDREHLRSLNEHLDVQTVAGSGTTVGVLREAGIDDCDVLFACTSSDEVNMIAALIGATIFHVPKVVARLRELDHEASFKAIAEGLEGDQVTVNPDLAAVEKILSLLPVPGALDIAPFLDGRLLVAGFPIRPDSDFAGLLLSHLRLLFPASPVLVVAIRRGERWLIPRGDDEIKAADTVYFAIDPAEMDNVLSLLGVRRSTGGRVMIAGATRIGLALAARLDQERVQVTLIEESEALARQAAAMLSGALVIHGMATSQEVLEEEGIERASAFVACTDKHPQNVVSCLLARRLGVGHTFALVDDPGLSGLVGELGIDAIISPRLLTVGLALHFARRGRIRAAAAFLEDFVEAVEVDVAADSRLVRGPLADLGLPRGVIVAAVLRDGRLVVPLGNDRILPGDRALLVTAVEEATTLDEFLSG
jgi:trk system potassium uptake protein TrkA